MPLDLGPILTAMVTPFDDAGRLDEAAMVALMHHLVEHGSDGLVVCGTTGEAATMDDDEHLRVIELAASEMKGRCPVVAGVGSNDTRHAVKLTERATALGADALLSVNPYYNRPGRRGVLAHYGEVTRATDLPIILYNIPQRTGADLPNELLAELAQLEGIEAVKQATPANLDRRPLGLRRQRRPACGRAGPRRTRWDPHREPPVRGRDARHGRRARSPP
jgi:4-hydroxy-tetrahydrodipicolinate synthase